LIALLLFIGPLIASSSAQSTPKLLASTDSPAIVRSVRLLSGPAVEILSNRPIVPDISKLDNPPRLVIDLPNADLPNAELSKADRLNADLANALLAGNNDGSKVSSQEIRRIRVSRYQNALPVTQVVIDLVKPVRHSWDAAGNRLMVRLHASDEVAAKPASVPAFTAGVQPVAVPLGPGSSGKVILVGSHAAAGSSVTAGSETSVLRLERGGEVLVCPGTTVSVTSSQNGHALMLGMNTGALEAHYDLDASADSILTPDFRILMAGPGEFHYAVSADSRGNTCVRALPGNTASVIVSELLGDGNYQVKPSEQIVFHSGRLNLVDTAVPSSCGCPPPEVPVLRASAVTVLAASDEKAPSFIRLAQPGEVPPETAALPPSKPSDVHVQVEAPFVFRATDLPGNAARGGDVPKSAPIREAALLQVRYLPPTASFEVEVLPPPQTHAKTAHHGVFGKIKGFFVAIFS